MHVHGKHIHTDRLIGFIYIRTLLDYLQCTWHTRAHSWCQQYVGCVPHYLHSTTGDHQYDSLLIEFSARGCSRASHFCVVHCGVGDRSERRKLCTLYTMCSGWVFILICIIQKFASNMFVSSRFYGICSLEHEMTKNGKRTVYIKDCLLLWY